jgi:hypothetical protein
MKARQRTLALTLPAPSLVAVMPTSVVAVFRARRRHRCLRRRQRPHLPLRQRPHRLQHQRPHRLQHQRLRQRLHQCPHRRLRQRPHPRLRQHLPRRHRLHPCRPHRPWAPPRCLGRPPAATWLTGSTKAPRRASTRKHAATAPTSPRPGSRPRAWRANRRITSPSQASMQRATKAATPPKCPRSSPDTAAAPPVDLLT